MVAVQILVQAAIAVGLVPQQQRCRPPLAGGVTDRPELVMDCRKAGLDPHGRVPTVGDGRQVRIQRFAQPPDHVGQRVAEILVLAPAEGVALHHDAAAKALLLEEAARECVALGWRQQRGQHGEAAMPQVVLNRMPVHGVDAGFKRAMRRKEVCSHGRASFSVPATALANWVFFHAANSWGMQTAHGL
ncbi:hypothetical protein D9M72_520250 [compost metagenome]